MCCKTHPPLSSSLFFPYRPHHYIDQKSYISMKNQQDKAVIVLEFSLNRIYDLEYGKMVKKWFKDLNPTEDLTPSLAFHIWAGIAINTFFFASWEEKIDMIEQESSRIQNRVYR